MNRFDIEMLPAEKGDALLLSWGDASAPRRILIDAGRKKTGWRIVERFRGDPSLTLDAFVVTHVDSDHIEGAIPLLMALEPSRVGDVWFNGWKHLKAAEVLGPADGEVLSLLLNQRFSWNRCWGEGPVVTGATADPLPMRSFGDLRLTLLSPTPEKLRKLIPFWKKECKKHGLRPGDHADATAYLEGRRAATEAPADVADARVPTSAGAPRPDLDALGREPFAEDSSHANGSSIALLAEYDNRAALLLGDAHPSVVAESLGALCAARGVERIVVNAVKLSHHGSTANLSDALLARIDARAFLISTNGAHHGHPDGAALARLLARFPDAHLVFNYRTNFNGGWDPAAGWENARHTATYPPEGAAGVVVAVR